jgi:hypothetical protein
MGKPIELAQFLLHRMMLENRVRAATERSIEIIMNRQRPNDEQECALCVIDDGKMPRLAWVVGPLNETCTIAHQGGGSYH